ncbi:MAG: EAL domain-containing protein [Salinisphaera sp.]|uniref:putative bifunctional diguanylate cyclase/phosphodiesterase n=1 Tax=Salinisphaera sp. TaxID=1914330 RepID=UPI003C7B1205
MVEHAGNPHEFLDLRATAEKLIVDREIDSRTLSHENLRALVHELQVHQIELELQNDEMQRAYMELDSLRADLQDLYQLAPVGYIALRRDGLILRANRAAGEMLGVAPAALEGTRFYRYVSPPDLAAYYAHRHYVATEALYGYCELQICPRDGPIRDIRVDSLPKFNGSGQLAGYRTTLVDITELKQLQQQLRVNASVVSATSEAVVICDIDARITAVNPAFLEVTGLSDTDIVGRPLYELVDQSSAVAIRAAWETLLRKGHWAAEWRIRGRNAHVPVWGALSTVSDEPGFPLRVAGILSDLTTQKEAEERLYRQANYDTLTGLPNRTLFGERLTHSARQANREDRRLALLFLDLDRFKMVNDTLGHSAGDELLAEVARRLKSCVRESDTLARIGGDEFALILTDFACRQDVAVVARKALKQLSRPFALSETEVQCGASIGIAVHPDDSDDLGTLRRHADIAMYEVKRTGRNGYRFFSQRMMQAATAHLHVVTELRRALREDELELLYQPIFMLDSGALFGVESLLRWNHPSRGRLSPSSFLEVAEDSGLIREIGEWVLAQACCDARQWRKTLGAGPASVCINLSGHQLNDPVAYDRLRASLDDFGSTDFDLVLEMTETVAIDATYRSGERLNAFKALGIRLAMDDFGKGYSSLAALKALPFDIIKIDKSFVQDLDDSRSTPLIDAIIAMSHALDLIVVAEGVETEDQLRILRAKGCDAAQGYHLGHPMDAAALAANFAGNDTVQ